MSLRDYIKGERCGKEAHELEREAMDDPFLQDAIEGYDQLNNYSASRDLKKLKSQINKRTRDTFFYLQLLSIVACILIIICLTIFFFIYDRDRSGRYGNAAYTENRVDNESPPINNNPIDTSINQVEAKKENVEAINKQENSFPENEQLTIQQELEKKYDENLINYWDYQPSDEISNNSEMSDYSVSDNEIQTIFSEYHEDKKETNSLNQSPKPVGGQKAYDDYIKNNLKNLSDNPCENQHGKVILLFKVNENGRPIDIAILRSVCKAVDREAIKLLQNGPDWTVSNNSTQMEIVF